MHQTRNAVITLGQLAKLQEEIDDKKHQIIVMRKKIEMYLNRKDEKLTPEEKAKIPLLKQVKDRLKEYRKAIGKSNKNRKSLYQFTVDKFEHRRATIRKIDQEIQQLQERIDRVKQKAIITKAIIDKINIPRFKDDLLKLDFNKCMTINMQMLKAIKSADFYKDEIADKQNQANKLKQEVARLKPPLPAMKVMKVPPKRNPTIEPSPEMKDCISFEDSRMKIAIQKSVPVFKKAKQAPNRLSVTFKSIEKRMAGSSANFGKMCQKAKNVNPSFKAPRRISPISVFDMVKEKAGKINELKERIANNQADLEAIMTDIPQIMSLSPEGLLKWREQLLKQREVMRKEYDEKINKARGQLRDAKLILNRRVAALQKMSPRK
ncbi:hypothetical protein TRFO_36033 [Tritrichomonas foetus]|uniref:Uncharacterized protein n=1 Tax=Tritrichomonas foetus TaxID=1144522 RepID=A0A1J4JKD8_9EUKA|nr:hypothetical protein TRFO_36033 [Tritrichomonas foetus]|eukprot:OHS97708.1 hypothetical protein TRFO_36033 [Tritrichomonas foetus]